MSEQDKTLMAEYGVTSSTKTVYFLLLASLQTPGSCGNYRKCSTSRMAFNNGRPVKGVCHNVNSECLDNKGCGIPGMLLQPLGRLLFLR